MRRVPKIPLMCDYEPCSKPFEVFPSAFKRGARYCSAGCVTLAFQARSRETLADRFWAKVQVGTPEECWLWQGTTVGNGYGAIFVVERERQIGAHIVSWYLHHGTWPPDGIHVLHDCPGGEDRPGCVNPAHLWLGTHTQNVQDMHAKGRSVFQKDPERATAGIRRWVQENPTRPQTSGDRNGMRLHPESVLRGEKHPLSKLTDAQWQEALTLHADGWGIGRLAKRYGVSKPNIARRLKHQL